MISFSILRAVDAPEKQTAKAQNLGLTWCQFDDEILGSGDRLIAHGSYPTSCVVSLDRRRMRVGTCISWHR